jgi:hypothetical protein
MGHFDTGRKPRSLLHLGHLILLSVAHPARNESAIDADACAVFNLNTSRVVFVIICE